MATPKNKALLFSSPVRLFFKNHPAGPPGPGKMVSSNSKIKHLTLRRGNFSSGRTFPVGGSSNWRVDYPVGYLELEQLSPRVRGYFFRNQRWKKTRFLFSHLRESWSPRLSLWLAYVFWVGRRRRRRLSHRWGRWLTRRRRRRHVAFPVYRIFGRNHFRPRRRERSRRRGRKLFFRGGGLFRWGKLAQVRQFRRSTPWEEMSRCWNFSGQQWRWCRLSGLRWGNSSTLMSWLSFRLQGRFERRIRGVALPLLKLTRRLGGVQGAQVCCSGRFTRSPRAQTKRFQWGKLSRGNPTTPVEQSFVTRALRFGAIGVTLFISYQKP